MPRAERLTRMPFQESRFKINFKFRRKRGEKKRVQSAERSTRMLLQESRFKINFKFRRKKGREKKECSVPRDQLACCFKRAASKINFKFRRKRGEKKRVQRAERSTRTLFQNKKGRER